MAKSTKSRVIDLNKVMKDKGSLLVDGVHPNAEGHALMAVSYTHLADGAPQQREDKLKAMAGKRCLEIIA